MTRLVTCSMSSWETAEQDLSNVAAELEALASELGLLHRYRVVR